MQQLHNFEKNMYRLLNRRVSIYQDHVRKKGLVLADKNFRKTRFSSHIDFLSKCLRRGLIPKGFLLSFHASNLEQSNSSRYKRQLSSILTKSSRRLMVTTISSMVRRCHTLTTEIVALRNELKDLCSVEAYRNISPTIHQLNADVYDSLVALKCDKLAALTNSTTPEIVVDAHDTPAPKLVVTIPDDLQLDSHERSVLERGLNYISTRKHCDEYTAKADCEKFYRRLRLKAHFSSNQESSEMDTSQTPDPSEDTTLESLKPKTSKWTPPPGRFGSLDYYISKCRSEVNKLDFKRHLETDNLSPGERAALTSLRQRADIVIKPADKGGAVVVWDRNLYIQEAERQLSDSTFYERLDRDFTMDYNKTVCEVVKEANFQHAPSILSWKILSRFYLLPKIHKPGNPGRPIVSACNCPTELIATYLDRITTPLVQSLPSYVKDTNHMLRIVDSFRFPGNFNYVFTMDVKSLYTVIPNGDGLLALTHFLNKRPILQPPTHTLVRLAELVLTLNTFSFNGNFYRQTGGVAMGSRLGPNYACLFMGHIAEQIFDQYTGTKPVLYKRYIDDIAGATSGSREEIEDFATYVNGFYPSLNFTWVISDVQLPFLDLCLKPTPDRLLTSIYYKTLILT